jgi:selenocysteine-specific elongation factor
MAIKPTIRGLNRQFVIGTAGHIDHGKTALVKALTGIDTDRLPEEKDRGITIDLGFAHLSDNITIIDVPGHERLIKNMVSGVSTIDLVLFVIAADDGVMPQTREHLDIINLLGIQNGIAVITKIDLVDNEWLALVQEDIKNLFEKTNLKNIDIYKSSAETGKGVIELKEAILRKLGEIPAKKDFEIFREPVDRVFTVQGFGTVITGTVLSGSLKIGDQIEIHPAGLRARVRSLQSHDKEVGQVSTGFRAAVNVAGIYGGEIKRGDTLVEPDYYAPVQIFNARLWLLKSSPRALKSNQRIRVHFHTTEALARIIIPERNEAGPGESVFVQIRLEQPFHLSYQDRFIIRQYSPQITIGGGIVLQTNPGRYRKKYLQFFLDKLNKLEGESPQQKILAVFDDFDFQSLSLKRIKVGTNISFKDLENQIKLLEKDQKLFPIKLRDNSVYFSDKQVAAASNKIESVLEKFHIDFPNRPGLTESEITGKLGKNISADLMRLAMKMGTDARTFILDDTTIRLAKFKAELSSKESQLYSDIINYYEKAGFSPPTNKAILDIFSISRKEFKELTTLMRKKNDLIFLDETLFIHSSFLQKIEEMVLSFFEEKPEMSISEFKEISGTTRKHALPLLIYLDKKGITVRDGDVRKKP